MNPSILPVMGFSLAGKRIKAKLNYEKLLNSQLNLFLASSRTVFLMLLVIGGKIKEYHIILDPIKISQSWNYTCRQLLNVLSESNIITSNGINIRL